jgi:biotin carboxyl carrier protein
MENEITAPRSGTVAEVCVRPGQAVEAGELLARID